MTTESNITVIPDATASPALPAVAPPREGITPQPFKLSEPQTEAITAISEGLSFGKVAERAGVDRATVYRWRTTDPNFIAALNQWRSEIQMHTRDRMHAIVEKAAESVDRVVEKNQGRIELKIIEKMDCLKPGPNHPIDPYAIFGNGIDDETGRWRILEGMKRAAKSMTQEQTQRAPQLLALGVALDNARTGRPSPADLIEMAGWLANELPSVSTAAGEGAMVIAPNDNPPPDAPPAPVKVKATVVRHGAGIGAVIHSLPFFRRR
ncbi:MAG TPA: hypothetical protein VFC46_07475 [Humisphaera sp.]|nr:hypothetical protein [Humisphaera sp.]